jgi:preprotein translocase subunit SecB
VRDGGFPPLLLEPIDFAGMYQAQADAEGQPQVTTAETGTA